MKRLTWPVPALLVWMVAWLLFLGPMLVPTAPAKPWLGLFLGVSWSLWATRWAGTAWRSTLMALGFPVSLSLMATLSGSAPAWLWLLPLLLLMVVYPIHAWRDAPLFPTPTGALQALARHAPLPAQALILDAGCGLGDGLKALRSAYPLAQYHGIEWSWPLRALCALRCPWAKVRQGDIWQADWSRYDLVYLFQRPESMARAAARAKAQLAPGAWLVSLEFEVSEWKPLAVLPTAQGRKIWVYRQPFTGQKSSRGS